MLAIVTFSPVCGAMSGAGAPAVEADAVAREEPAPQEDILHKTAHLDAVCRKLGITRYAFEGNVSVHFIFAVLMINCWAWRLLHRPTHPAEFHGRKLL